MGQACVCSSLRWPWSGGCASIGSSGAGWRDGSSPRIRFRPMDTPKSRALISSSSVVPSPSPPRHGGMSSRIDGGGGASTDSSPVEQIPSFCVPAYLDMRRKMLLQSFFMWPSSLSRRAFSRRSSTFWSPDGCGVGGSGDGLDDIIT
jgi:hypothetical protein